MLPVVGCGTLHCHPKCLLPVCLMGGGGGGGGGGGKPGLGTSPAHVEFPLP